MPLRSPKPQSKLPNWIKGSWIFFKVLNLTSLSLSNLLPLRRPLSVPTNIFIKYFESFQMFSSFATILNYEKKAIGLAKLKLDK
ncbi:hypothetical protein BpHYR1_037035 [Brachionus plicatilis]|uniref:Uncharacterized protein n=1 Tax=Brachionus plicatilis TaxID=10195 RepID=A0A3M7SMI2_BRAPC|nr:hypothetical protein BpHYR1_037035 [Brachionus plicatilis]